MIKDIQSKIDPLHRATPQTSETLMKINDRVKALHADTVKSQPDLIKRLDSIDQHLNSQQNQLVEPMKRWIDEKFSPLVEQERNRVQAKKDGEDKFGR